MIEYLDADVSDYGLSPDCALPSLRYICAAVGTLALIAALIVAGVRWLQRVRPW